MNERITGDWGLRTGGRIITQHSALSTQHWLNAPLPLTALSSQEAQLEYCLLPSVE
ncbi:hypothetical protein [Nostoc sp.]|uniref:hypothetical protein n=1 Tax=Nostoc sp. TaxID=1180 RepID=UPI002FF74C63